MADTIVNTPGTTERIDSTGSGAGFILGAILAVILAFIFFYHVLPIISSGINRPSNVNVEAPKQIDVNVNRTK